MNDQPKGIIEKLGGADQEAAKRIAELLKAAAPPRIVEKEKKR